MQNCQTLAEVSVHFVTSSKGGFWRTGCFRRSPWHVGLQADVRAAAGSRRRRGARRVRFEPLLLLLHSHLQHVDLPWEQVERGRYGQLAGDRQNEIAAVEKREKKKKLTKTSSSTLSPISTQLRQAEFDVTDLTDGVDEALPQLPGLCTRHLSGTMGVGGGA